MVITENTSKSWKVIRLQGRFVIRNLSLVRRFFENSEKNPLPGVGIDLSGVTQIDSSAITILINFQRRIIRKNGLLVLFGMRSDIAEIFSIVGIEKMFRICRDREEFEFLYTQKSA